MEEAKTSAEAPATTASGARSDKGGGEGEDVCWVQAFDRNESAESSPGASSTAS